MIFHGFGPLPFSFNFHQIPHGTVPRKVPIAPWARGHADAVADAYENSDATAWDPHRHVL
jgi:hypothetical protein